MELAGERLGGAQPVAQGRHPPGVPQAERPGKYGDEVQVAAPLLVVAADQGAVGPEGEGA
ncbi:hypothetical protein QR97_26820 [Streptomyces sp. PBH53]|nr:hypothetical protein QR97_26820 [Streptomyces sp. PBH53]